MNALALKNPDAHAVVGNTPLTLTEIYNDHVNLACWRRALDTDIQRDVSHIMNKHRQFAWRTIIQPNEIQQWLASALQTVELSAFVDDVSMQAEMFADLFDLTQIGVRLELLDKTMCPRFHIDKVMGRLISTYSGLATQWLDNAQTDRSKLGMGSGGLPDHLSGIYHDANAIQTASVGDVLLMKGANWANEQVGALVHRSPPASETSRRLVLSFDFAS